MSRLPFVWELDLNGSISHLVGTCHDGPDIYQSHVRQLLEGKRMTFLEVVQPKIYEEYHKNRHANELHDLLETYRADSEDNKTNPRYGEFGARLYKRLMELDDAKRTHVLEAKRKQNNQRLFGHDENLAIDVAIFDASQALDIPLMAIETEAMVNEVRSWTPPESRDRFASPTNYYAAYQSGDLPKFMLELQRIEGAWLQADTQDWQFNSRRNQQMIANSLPFLAKPCLVAVGIAHVITFDPTLIRGYQEKGIKVKRI